MRYLTWNILAFTSSVYVIGSTITGLALMQEKLEHARIKALSRRHRPFKNYRPFMEQLSPPEKVNKASGRRTARPIRRRSKSNMKNLNQLEIFKAHYNVPIKGSKDNSNKRNRHAIKTLDTLKKITNKYKNRKQRKFDKTE